MKSRFLRTASALGSAGIMTGGGVMHFVAPRAYVEVIPLFLPFPYPLVYISGVGEIAAGVLLALPKTRRIGAWTVIAVLVAIFPANVYMAIRGPREGSGFPFNSSTALWLRLPLQGALIAWADRLRKSADMPDTHPV
ncbi:MAG: DoxX family protein [Actinomycetota bacterium]